MSYESDESCEKWKTREKTEKQIDLERVKEARGREGD